jgi:hypothetical protein
MGLFDRLFRREKIEKNKYDLESLEKMFKTKIDEQQKTVEPELQGYYKDVLQLGIQLKNSLKILDSAVPKERMDEQLLFVAKTGRLTFKNKILRVSDAINKSVDSDFHSLSEYYNDCVSTFNEANDSTLTEFRTIGIVFEDEGNQVLNDMISLKNLLKGMGNTIKNCHQTVEPWEEVLENILGLRKLLDELEGNNKNIQEMREEIENKKNELSELKKEIQDLTDSKEWKEYQNAVERKKNLGKRETEVRTNFNEMISSIERPMKKAERLMDQEKDKYGKLFEGYLNDPFETFLKDDGEEALNSFLETIKKLLMEKKVDVSENIREKTIDKIDEWVSKQVFKKLKEEYSSAVESMKEIIEDELEIQKSNMEKRESQIENEIEELNNRIEQAEKQMEGQKTNLEEMKKEVGKKLTELLGSETELNLSIK